MAAAPPFGDLPGDNLGGEADGGADADADMEERPDSADDVLGSGNRYKPSHDIRSSMSVPQLSKSFDKSLYFGAKAKGRSEEDRNSSDLEDWQSSITSRIVDVRNDIFGGTVLEYLRDPTFDPQIVSGTSYFPADGDGWRAFKATRFSVAALAERKRAIRKWIHGVVFNFSCGYWRDMERSCPEKENGQTIIGLWKTFFMEDEIVNVAANAEKLRGGEFVIKGAEDPSKKLSEMLSGWTQIQKTAWSAAYGKEWFCSAVAATLVDNSCYSVFRQSGGLTRLLAAATPQEAVRLVRSCWVDNHKDWNKTITPRSQRSNETRGNAYPRRGNDKNNGKKNNGTMNNDVCSNCKRRGHTFDDCRMEGGGRATKCYNCDKYGHMARDCRQPKSGANGRPSDKRRSNKSDRRRVVTTNDDHCTYQRCDGKRSSHSTKSCPAKQRDDARSRANDPRQSDRSRSSASHKRDRERRRRYESPSSSDDDSGNDTPPRRVVKRSNMNPKHHSHSRPSHSLADDDSQE